MILQFFNYSIISAICLAVMLLPYLLWFRKMTFHQWNRFYLLGTIFFSLSAPLVNIEIKTAATPEIVKLKEDFRLFEETPNNLPIIKTENIPSRTDDITAYKQPEIDVFTSESTSTPWEIQDFLLLIYLLGFSGFLGMFLHRLAKLFKLIARGNKTQKQGFTSIHLQGKQVFSFFHFVFFDHNRYNENERQTLIKHEKVHIQQRHCLDILFVEILHVIFWFNPLFHLYKKFLQQEHEYLVDAISSKGIGKPQYAQMLLTFATPRPPLVGHAFAYIPIKHRIFKLFQKPSTTMDKSKFLIVLPLILTLFFTFSCSFDELEEIKDATIPTGEKVSNVKAFFVDEYATIKQEVAVGSMQLNEDGTIGNLEMKAHPVFGVSVPSNLREDPSKYLHASFFETIIKESGLPKDFYTKNAQWLFAGDIDIQGLYLGTILYAPYGKRLIETKRNYLSQEVGLDISDISNRGSNTFYFTAKKTRYTRQKPSEQSSRRKLEINDEGQIMLWVESYQVDNSWLNDKAFDSKFDPIIKKRLLNYQWRHDFIEVNYSLEGKLKDLVSGAYMTTEIDDRMEKGP